MLNVIWNAAALFGILIFALLLLMVLVAIARILMTMPANNQIEREWRELEVDMKRRQAEREAEYLRGSKR